MRRCHRVLGLVLCCRDTEDETNIMINDTESRSYKETPHHKVVPQSTWAGTVLQRY